MVPFKIKVTLFYYICINLCFISPFSSFPSSFFLPSPPSQAPPLSSFLDNQETPPALNFDSGIFLNLYPFKKYLYALFLEKAKGNILLSFMSYYYILISNISY